MITSADAALERPRTHVWRTVRFDQIADNVAERVQPLMLRPISTSAWNISTQIHYACDVGALRPMWKEPSCASIRATSSSACCCAVPAQARCGGS